MFEELQARFYEVRNMEIESQEEVDVARKLFEDMTDARFDPSSGLTGVQKTELVEFECCLNIQISLAEEMAALQCGPTASLVDDPAEEA